MKTLILTFILSCVIGLAHAQIPQPDPDTTAKHFLIVASISNLQEISASQLALKQSNNPAITSFAKMMLNYHNKGQQQLMQLAAERRYNIPSEASEGIKQDIQLLEAKGFFDALYVRKMVSDHNGAVQTFANYATVGKDPYVRKFAQDLLPILKQHLMEIKQIEMMVTKGN